MYENDVRIIEGVRNTVKLICEHACGGRPYTVDCGHHDRAARTHASEQRILARAQAREAEVTDRLDKLRPQAMTDDGAAKEYQVLTLERAKLAQVIGLAEQRIAG